ncbi:MAG: hypothetical protein Q9218_006801 [Villophora microphyllina]
MVRNNTFPSSYKPFHSQDANELQEPHITGPFSFLNPTRAHLRLAAIPQRLSSSDTLHHTATSNGDAAKLGNEEQYFPSIAFKWRSRDNRKGRHALVVAPPESADYTTPKPTSTLRETGRGILRMATQYPYWDISYLVAVTFTLGSLVWVLNAFLVYLPLAQPQTEFGTEILYGGGITAFIGATIFEVGSVLLMLEAVNENRAGCFGWALEEVLEGHGEKGTSIAVRPDKNGCSHHHTNEKNLVGKSNSEY